MEINHYKKYEPLFGAWYITDKIGRGAFGSVYVIERKELGITYRSALKAITIPQDKSEIRSIMSDGMTKAEATEYYRNLVQSIVNEFILMSKLKGNSHVVSYEDHVIMEHEDDIGWDVLIRMELLTPLVEYTADEIMAEPDVIRLGIGLCKALEFCRKYNIIHRDIKPENIFIAPSGDFKLGDFGIAKTVEKTRLGLSRKGTYLYMAPEVYRAEAYGATVDIYSLGIVMYKLINDNRTPFMPDFPDPITPDDKELALAKRLSGRNLPEPRNGSAGLKKIILKACAFQVENRYGSAQQMRRELEKLLYEDDSTVKTAEQEENIRAGAADVGEDREKRRGARYPLRKKLLASGAVLLLSAAGIIYAAIPKEVTDITGLQDGTELYFGDTMQPKYAVEPDFFAEEPLSFEAENKAILAVDETGMLTGLAVGESSLVLSAGGYTERITIQVVPKVTEIGNVKAAIRLEEGSSLKLKPKLKPEQFADEPISYSIDAPEIAKVTEEGRITAVSVGSAILTIRAGGCEKEVAVEVYEPEEPYYEGTWYPVYNTTPITEESAADRDSGTSDGFFNSSDDEYF